MIKKQQFMIIALIALIAFITMPAQAYTELSTYTATGGTTSGYEILANGFEFINSHSASHNVTYFEWQTFANLPAGANTTGTYSGGIEICGAAHQHGTYTATWSGGPTGSVKPFTLQVSIVLPHITSTANEDFILSNPGPTLGCADPKGVGSLYKAIASTGTITGMGQTATVHSYTSDVNQIGERGSKFNNATMTVYGGIAVNVPVASFSCTPTSQYPDTSVVCTDSSTNTPTSWLWTIDAEAMGIDAWQTHTGQNFTWESHYPGLYSVNLQATNTAGSDWENKTNYVSISVNATPNNCEIEPIPGYIRTYAQTNDGMTSGGIYNSNIQMHDMEGGAWSNVTNSGGWWCIDTLPGHSLNIYAQATGYTSAETLGASANGGRHYLVMWPDYIPAPSAGNVTLYALVYDQQTGAPLYLSMVRVDGNTINTVLTTTGLEGQAMFTIKNDTSIHVTASKTGYSSITKVITTSHFGPDTVMISLPRLTVTTIPTATPGPGGVTPVITQDPNDPSLHGGDTSLKAQEMMNWIAMNGMTLVQLCFLVTVLALLGVKLGK